jgi:hypothetical protein
MIQHRFPASPKYPHKVGNSIEESIHDCRNFSLHDEIHGRTRIEQFQSSGSNTTCVEIENNTTLITENIDEKSQYAGKAPIYSNSHELPKKTIRAHSCVSSSSRHDDLHKKFLNSPPEIVYKIRQSQFHVLKQKWKAKVSEILLNGIVEDVLCHRYPLPPKFIERYCIVSKMMIGSGSNGRVYLGRTALNHKPVAIKFTLALSGTLKEIQMYVHIPRLVL